MLEEDEHIFVYERYLDNESMIVINNFFEGEYEIELDIEGYEVLLSNYEETNISNKLIIRPYESLVLYKKD